MRILVTGYAGMNGAWTSRELLARGHEVIGTDVRAGSSWAGDAGSGRLTTAALDITDRVGVKSFVGDLKPDVIVHSAAITAPENMPAAGLDVNGVGSVNVLEAARVSGVRRVVFSSSKAVYGELDGEFGHPVYRPVSEGHPRSPVAQLRVYCATKYLVEEFGRRYAEAYGLEFLALRFATIYGPGKSGPVGVVSRLIEDPVGGQDVHIESGGDQLDEFIYVKDVANGVAAACEADAPQDWAFNIGTGQLASLHDIADALRPHIDPDRTITIGPGLDYLGIRGLYGLLDSSRSAAQLRYRPQFTLQAGVADYVRTLKSAAGSGRGTGRS